MSTEKFEDASAPLLRRLSPEEWLSDGKINALWKANLLFWIAFVLLPPLILVIMSFDSAAFIRIPQGFSLFKYQAMLQSEELIEALQRTLMLAVSTVVISVSLALLAILTYLKSRHKSIIIAIILLPAFIPGLIHGVSLLILFDQFNFTNSFLMELVGHVMWTFPFAFVALLMTVSGVPEEALEASSTLGSNEFETLKNVILPQISTGILAASIFSFVLSFNEFYRTFYLSGSDNTVTTFIFKQMNVDLSPELFAVAGTTAVVSILLIGGFTLKILLDQLR